MTLLPPIGRGARLTGVAPGGGDPASQLPPLSAAVRTLRSKRKVRRHKTNPQPRQLWRSEIKTWLESRGRGVDWGFNKRDEQEIINWFNALDMDSSGTVEEGEVRALVDAMGAEVAV